MLILRVVSARPYESKRGQRHFFCKHKTSPARATPESPFSHRTSAWPRFAALTGPSLNLRMEPGVPQQLILTTRHADRRDFSPRPRKRAKGASFVLQSQQLPQPRQHRKAFVPSNRRRGRATRRSPSSRSIRARNRDFPNG